MQRRRVLLSSVLAVALLAGCPGPTPVTPSTRTPRPTGSTTPAPTAAPTASPILGAATPTPPATTGALVGLVRLPASILAGVPGIIANNGSSIIANNGGGLVSNNGGGLISDKGGAYRLAAVEQGTLVGATVVLCDAAGKPLAGGAYTALTDASGRYAFAKLPALPRNATLRIELPGERGALTAFVPRNPAAGAAIDVDLVSTVATTYVLDRYVAGQPDPDVTLDRLPADVEAKTRAIAAGALATPPAKFDAASVVATVDALRRTDPALDAQLETVRRLLLLAGQSNGGADRPALSVALRGLRSLDIGPGGELWLASATDRRLYRVDGEGVLRVVAGSGGAQAGTADPTGKPAIETELGTIIGVLLEPSGAFWVLDSVKEPTGAVVVSRLLRIGVDGLVKEAWRDRDAAGFHPGLAMVPDGDGAVLLLQRSDAVLRIDAAGAKGAVATLAGPPGVHNVFARLGNGGFIRDAWRDGGSRLVAFPADGAGPGQVRSDLNAFKESVAADMRGRLLISRSPREPGFHLDELAADGARRNLLTARPTGLPEGYVEPMARDAAGRLYLAVADVVYQVVDGTATRVAGGGASVSTGGVATDQALAAPYGIAAMPGGGYAIGDAKILFRTDAAGKVTKLAEFEFPARELAAGPDGTVYGIVANRLVSVKPDGTKATLYQAGELQSLGCLRVDPDGALLFGRSQLSATQGTLLRLVPGDAAPTVLASGFKHMSGFDRAPDGSILILTQPGYETTAPALVRLPAGGGALVPVSTDARLAEAIVVSGSGIAVDAKGRVLYASLPDLGTVPVISRFDPATGAFTALTGPDGRAFKGGGPDESIGAVADLAFEPNGDLSFVDPDRRQGRRLTAAQLAD